VFCNSAEHNRKGKVQSAVEAGRKATASDIEAWSELERELQVRHRIFDKWVSDGKLAWADARDRYARLQRACTIVKRVLDLNDTPPSTQSESESQPSK
jgi:hypothetical protein